MGISFEPTSVGGVGLETIVNDTLSLDFTLFFPMLSIYAAIKSSSASVDLVW